MNRKKWIESLEPKSKAIKVKSDGTMVQCTIIEIEEYCNETLAKIITKRQRNMSANWVNVNSLVEPTESLISEIELKRKTDCVKNHIWLDGDKINAVYDILFGDTK